MRKKLLSLLLAALMILGLLPAAALAAALAAEGDAAPAVQAAEDVTVQADDSSSAVPTATAGKTVYTAVDTGLTMILRISFASCRVLS